MISCLWRTTGVRSLFWTGLFPLFATLRKGLTQSRAALLCTSLLGIFIRLITRSHLSSFRQLVILVAMHSFRVSNLPCRLLKCLFCGTWLTHSRTAGRKSQVMEKSCKAGGGGSLIHNGIRVPDKRISKSLSARSKKKGITSREKNSSVDCGIVISAAPTTSEESREERRGGAAAQLISTTTCAVRIMLSDYKILTITYNTNGREPCEPLHDLLGFNSDFYGSNEMPDLLAIGFQEVALHLSSLLQEDPWTRGVDRVLAPWDFVRLKQHRMQAILLLVYCKRSLMAEVRGLQSTQTKTGLSPLVGSKGAVSISCKISGVSFVITCAHLTAHQEKFENRVRDYATILDDQVFRDRQTSRIMSHDYGIFMGDLNFRIDNLTESEVHERVTTVFSTPGHRMRVVKEMLDRDQLTSARREGVAFNEYIESDVTFLPTFKFEVGSNQYDLSRKPAWTDRILYRFTANAYESELPALRLHLSPLKYASHPGYQISDHKPVSALFLFKAFNRRVYEKANLDEPTRISFLPITGWRNGEANSVWFTLSSKSRHLTRDDFVAIYRCNFLSLADEVCRSYVNLRQETNVSPPRVHNSPGHVHDVSWFKVTFSDTVLLQPSVYRFLYISSHLSDVFSMSPPFDVT